MRDLAYYTSLIPSWNASRPKFAEMVSKSVEPTVNVAAGLYEIRDSFDLDTAVGVQLDQIGEWIGRTRQLVVPLTDGFFSWDTDGLGWEEGYWQAPNTPSGGVVSLDDNTYRALLKAKAAANRWDGTLPTMAPIYQLLTGPGVYVIDNQDMSMTVYVSGVTLPPFVLQLLVGGYVPLKPMGVRIEYIIIPAPPPGPTPPPLFGFDMDGDLVAGFDTGYWGTVY